MIEEILKERGERYGDFKDHAKICQDLKKVMNSTMGWEFLSHSQAQALEVIADKIARMLNGDPNYDDNWVDIIGYSQLVLNELQEHDGQTKMDFNRDKFGEETLAITDPIIEVSTTLPIKGTIMDILIDNKQVKHIYTGTVWRPIDSDEGQRVFKECMNLNVAVAIHESPNAGLQEPGYIVNENGFAEDIDSKEGIRLAHKYRGKSVATQAGDH